MNGSWEQELVSSFSTFRPRMNYMEVGLIIIYVTYLKVFIKRDSFFIVIIHRFNSRIFSRTLICLRDIALFKSNSVKMASSCCSSGSAGDLNTDEKVKLITKNLKVWFKTLFRSFRNCFQVQVFTYMLCIVCVFRKCWVLRD